MAKTETYYVAFIDILGFSEFIKKYDKGLLPNVLNDLKSALDNATDFLKTDYVKEEDAFHWKKYLKVHLFSDCLCAALPININFNDTFHNLVFFTMYISTYQNLLMEKGFFARGGISIGSFYSDENMIFSGALVESVELEKKAVFPRILIDEKIIEAVEKMKNNDSDFLLEMFAKDQDNLLFLNNFNVNNLSNLVLKKNLEKVRLTNPDFAKEMESKMKLTNKFEIKDNIEFVAKIKKNIKVALRENQSVEKVFQKYLWLKNYFDWTCNANYNKRSFMKTQN